MSLTSSSPRELRRQLLDAQLAEQVPSLEAAVESQALELAEARALLATATATARTEASSHEEELRVVRRQLEEAQRHWRCHQHDGETKRRLLEEQARS